MFRRVGVVGSGQVTLCFILSGVGYGPPCPLPCVGWEGPPCPSPCWGGVRSPCPGGEEGVSPCPGGRSRSTILGQGAGGQCFGQRVNSS